jgi:RNA recognition motif-containing protein
MAERLQIKKFGICQDQPRGYLEAGIVMHQKEEVRIVDRFNNVERDMKEKLKDSINRKKEHILKEMIEKKKSEQEERLRKMYGNVDAKKTIRRTYNNENTIKVQGYPPSYGREDLERLFSVIGEIKKINIPVDINTGKNKPFAYIDFKQSISVNEAISRMDDYAVGVCVLSVSRPPPQKN